MSEPLKTSEIGTLQRMGIGLATLLSLTGCTVPTAEMNMPPSTDTPTAVDTMPVGEVTPACSVENGPMEADGEDTIATPELSSDTLGQVRRGVRKIVYLAADKYNDSSEDFELAITDSDIGENEAAYDGTSYRLDNFYYGGAPEVSFTQHQEYPKGRVDIGVSVENWSDEPNSRDASGWAVTADISSCSIPAGYGWDFAKKLTPKQIVSLIKAGKYSINSINAQVSEGNEFNSVTFNVFDKAKGKSNPSGVLYTNEGFDGLTRKMPEDERISKALGLVGVAISKLK